MKRIFVVFLLFITISLQAQTYWQQHIDTKISVSLDDIHHMLNGYEEIIYSNNSPDTLKYIYIHLWPNAYKNDHTPFEKQQDVNGNTAFYYSSQKDKGYIDSLQFAINGTEVDFFSSTSTPDIARIELKTPLLPGGKMSISTPFRVKIPKVFSRMGHTGQAYYISQWFPKPAVYDKTGWHPISYHDQGEFYSDYGAYDVAITLPKNYILLATGNCTDENENKWMDELAAQPLPADTLYQDSYPPSAAEMKTVHYHEDNVHDFAWFADKRWVVRKDTVYSPGNNKLVTTWSAFLPAYQQSWKNVCIYLKETVRHYGKWVGAYPYATIKAVEGDMKAGGGMEYPTITVIDKSATNDLRTTVIHEGGHNWFYGLLGTNERDHAWMDEGMNTFYEKKTSFDLDNANNSSIGVIHTKKLAFAINEDLLYYTKVATHEDQPIEQTSADFNKINYGVDVYYKTALMLKWLEQYMGAADFEAGMKDYFDKWHYKHPYSEDFEVCMKRHTAKDINWFFEDMLHTDKKIDFKIAHVNLNEGAGNTTAIVVHNNSGVLSPALVDVVSNDSIITKIWTKPFTDNDTITTTIDNWDKLLIDNIIPDAKTTNNEYRRHAMFHNFGISVRPFGGLNRTYKDKLYIAPAVGYNQYDGIMAGLLFHNITVPENRFRFAVAPMYAFESQSFAGAGSVGYLWYMRGLFKSVLLQTDMKMFHYDETLVNLTKPMYAGYTKIAPYLNFTFDDDDKLSPVERVLTLKSYFINEQNFAIDAAGKSKPTLQSQQKTYGLLCYAHENNRTYNPFNYDFEGEMGADFAKVSTTFNIVMNYNKKDNGMYIRAFAGKFFPINSNPEITDRYAFNASFSGLDDYLYDGTFIGRNARNNTAAQQIMMQEGGFKIPVFDFADRSNNWMATLNMETDLPFIKQDIRLFFDAGLIPNVNPTVLNPSSTSMLYDGGVSVRFFNNLVAVYFPIIMSNDFQNYLDNTYGRKNQFTRSISFTINLQSINWLLLPEHGMKVVEHGN